MKNARALLLTVLFVVAASYSYALSPTLGTEQIINHDRNYSQWEWVFGLERSHEMVVSLLEQDSYTPVLSPDGDNIAFSNYLGIWIVRHPQGWPELLFDTVMMYENEDMRSSDNCKVLCFTPDSREVTFMYYTYDEDHGSYIDNEYGHIFIRYPCPVIASVNIDTKSVRTIVKNGEAGFWNADGTKFLFNRRDEPLFESDRYLTDSFLYELDMETGEETYIDFNEDYNYVVNPGYSADGEWIFHAAVDELNIAQIFRMNVKDGYSEQLTDFDRDSVVGNIDDFSLSSTGEWILYSGQKPLTEINQPDVGSTMTYYALNTISGETIRVLPSTKYYCSHAWFSDYDDKFCYRLYARNEENKCYFMVMDFDLESVSVAEETPLAMSLGQPYPNPFNPATTISFSLAESNFTELSVYNIAGQKIRTLASGILSAGQHSIVWDGMNENGMPVSSGIYFTRLKSGALTKTARMTLMR